MGRYEFELPDPGEGLTEAEIIEWHVAAGGEISEDEPLCNVETDKAVVEIPAPCDGTVAEFRADVGDTVTVGEVIAVFETDDPPIDAEAVEETTSADAGEAAIVERAQGSPADAAATQVGTDSSDDTEAMPSTDDARAELEPTAANGAMDAQATTGERDADDDERVFAAPSTRRYAREQGVDLTDIAGSGPKGRILREDVDGHAAAAPAEPTTEIGDGDTGVTDASAAADTSEPGEAAESRASVHHRALRGLRKTIAENMVQSKTEIPHVTSGFEADADDLVALRDRLNEKHDVRISYTAILAKAVVPALQEYPVVNASVDIENDEIVEKRYYHVGVATHTEDGLLVPVVRDVDRKSLVEVAAELEDLVDRARERELDREELQGSTFTITNLGSHSEHGTSGTPIINYPEAAILGVGHISDKPVAVSEDDFEVRKRIGFSFSYDHRIVDGMTAASFMEHVIEGIEDPDMLLSRL